MSDADRILCTAFEDSSRLAAGRLAEVAPIVRAAMRARPAASFLVFDDATGRVIDIDPREPPPPGAPPQPPEAAARSGRGRPKLGVVAREVTLLPRHWDWLTRQPGGASQALRRLVDEARRVDGGHSAAREARAAAYAFLSAMAGDRAGFEEAARALFAGDADGFVRHSRSWPPDIRAHAEHLATPKEGADAGLS
ncbi:hypothetical protein J2X65_000334 [Ancylobacter sp. 3268]|uniref:DUF2239 family protein n=1 Tax=Ancylobacter sp. 3268 TaxID=2817752 RepID=UPI00285A9D7F|nr:DUF2239 family protein [Ancylobacter sp. 3268]MDR6950991.1 hypothetical protein [Ancylobacter sp. 3268]